MATPQNNNNYPPFASWTSATFAYSAVVNLPLPPFSAFCSLDARTSHIVCTCLVQKFQSGHLIGVFPHDQGEGKGAESTLPKLERNRHLEPQHPLPRVQHHALGKAHNGILCRGSLHLTVPEPTGTPLQGGKKKRCPPAPTGSGTVSKWWASSIVTHDFTFRLNQASKLPAHLLGRCK